MFHCHGTETGVSRYQFHPHSQRLGFDSVLLKSQQLIGFSYGIVRNYDNLHSATYIIIRCYEYDLWIFMIQSHTISYPIWPSGIDAMLGVERWSLATSCPGQRLHCLPSVHCGQCTILCLCRDSQRWSLGAELISLSDEIMMFEKCHLFCRVSWVYLISGNSGKWVLAKNWGLSLANSESPPYSGHCL